MEGKHISAQNIAERQGATQEEKAKSSVASFVTTLGRAAVIVLKIMLGLVLFPITAFIMIMIILLVGAFVGFSEFDFANFGELGNLPEVMAELGAPLMIFSFLLVLVPAIYIGYLLVMLLINRRPKLWVLIVSILLWLMMLVGVISSGVRYAGRSAGVVLNMDLEEVFEDEGSSLSRQIMESLDKAPDAEQQAEIERLKYDPTAQSID